AAPNVTLLDCRKPKPFPWPHVNTTSQEQTYIRWCCIDLSNAPRLPGVYQAFEKSRRYLLRFCYFRRVFTILGRLERNRSIRRASWSWPLWSDKPAEPYFHARWWAIGA